MPDTRGMDCAYGCVFCATGKERATARFLETACDGLRAITVRQIKQRTVRGTPRLEEILLYPGYVFFRAPAHEEFLHKFAGNGQALSVLQSAQGDWRLYGDDARQAEWLFSYDGLLSFSQAYKEGDWIRIVSGPLKDLEGQIVRFDKRHKSAQVALTFCNREVKAWLQFELVDKG